MTLFLRTFVLLVVGSFLYWTLGYGRGNPGWQRHSNVADSLHHAGQFSDASTHWEHALALATDEVDSVKNWLRFRLLYAQGLSFNYEREGIDYLQKAYSLLEFSRLDDKEKGAFLNTYYHFLGYNGRWEEALPLALECASYYEKAASSPPLDYLSAVHDVAYIHNKLGNYKEAIDHYHISIAGYVQHNGPMNHDVALGYNNLAFNYGLVGMSNRQLEYYTKAASIWSSIDLEDNSYLSTVYGNLLRWQREYGDTLAMEGLLASIKDVVGRKSEGWGTQNRLVVRKGENENHALQLSYWKACLDFYLLKNDGERIKNYLDSTRISIQSLPGKPQNNVLEYLNNAYSVLGEYHSEKGDHEQAARAFRKAITEMEHRGYTGNMAHSYAKLAQSLMESAELNEAESLLNKAFSSSKNPKDLPLFHTLAVRLAEKRNQEDSIRFHVGRVVAAMMGKPELASDLSLLNVDAFTETINQHYIRCLNASGQALLQLYKRSQHKQDLVNSNQLFTVALELLNRYYLGGPYTKPLADLQMAIHEGLLQCHVLSNEGTPMESTLSKLFEKLENNRSQYRWKKFIRHSLALSETVPDSLRRAEEEERQLLVFYKQRYAKAVADSVTEGSLNEIRVKIRACEEALAKTEDKIFALNEQYLALSQGRISTQKLQQRIPRNATMLRYLVTDSSTYVMRIDRSSIALISLGETAEVTKRVQEASEHLRSRSDEYYTSSLALFQLILGPVAAEKQLSEELVIIPDGILHQIPFEALTNNGSTSGFLVHKHTVSYAANASLWLAQQGIQYQGERTFGVFAPDYANASGTQAEASTVPLAGASREASLIGELLRGNVYNQSSLGKDHFVQQAPNYTILHLAMHANVHDENSERSHFHFGDDSKLYAYELYGMRLRSNMVVLSACNTGQGPMHRGEGVESLATAFTYAGVPSLVMGLWSLPDASTSGIMVKYYQNLKESQSKNLALRAAKENYLQEVAEDGHLQHPFYWAGLIVSGDVEPIQKHGNLYFAGIALALGAVLILSMRYYRLKT